MFFEFIFKKGEEELKVTYLIGNGLDINIGLRTRYLDFYKHIKRINKQNSKNNIYQAVIKDYFSKNKELIEIDWSDFEIGIGEYTKGITNEAELANFFIDYEELIEEFTNFIEAQLEKVDIQKFISKSHGIFNAAVTKPINLDERDQVYLQQNYRGYGNQQKERNYIVFNYTEIFDEIHESWKEKYKNNGITSHSPIHIHGFCQEQILMGVNDESQVSGEYSKDIDLQMMMIKTISNQNALTMRFEKATKTILDSELIIIYGMSIGDSDKYWWEKIIENLEKNPGNNVLIYAYDHEKDKLRKHNYKLMKRKREWKNNLLKHVDNDRREILEKQIFVQFDTKRIFDFEILSSKEVEKSLESVES